MRPDPAAGPPGRTTRCSVPRGPAPGAGAQTDADAAPAEPEDEEEFPPDNTPDVRLTLVIMPENFRHQTAVKALATGAEIMKVVAELPLPRRHLPPPPRRAVTRRRRVIGRRRPPGRGRRARARRELRPAPARGRGGGRVPPGPLPDRVRVSVPRRSPETSTRRDRQAERRVGVHEAAVPRRVPEQAHGHDVPPRGDADGADETEGVEDEVHDGDADDGGEDARRADVARGGDADETQRHPPGGFQGCRRVRGEVHDRGRGVGDQGGEGGGDPAVRGGCARGDEETRSASSGTRASRASARRRRRRFGAEEAKRLHEISRREHPRTPADFAILREELRVWTMEAKADLDAKFPPPAERGARRGGVGGGAARRDEKLLAEGRSFCAR